MKRSIPWVVVIALVAGSAVLAGIKEEWTVEAKPTRNVILVGWDGAGRERIKQFMTAGDLPNLKKLSQEGTLVAIDIVRTTDTKAGWTQILTGYEPEKTGVFSNKRYRPIPEGYTVFERLEKFFGPGFVTVFVSGKKKNLDEDPPQNKILASVPKHHKAFSPYRERNIVVEGGVGYEVMNGKPYYLTSKNVDVFINGLLKDDKVGKAALKLLDKHVDDRFFFFVHFAEIDHRGHHSGEDSEKTHQAYLSADRWLGKIVGKLEKLGIHDETLVYVTSDHGFDVGMQRHKDAPYVWLATNDPQVMRRGERADIAPTILERFGVDLSSIDPPLDGHPLTQPHTQPMW